ncbi:cyclin-dependent kinase 11B-like [Spodoptera frugiperda]|uniref:Cyclin-dependent kinase 11B-like n=1 Tax=Spodoptera frugiperda TaxID=7108 RepID=A0A9R0EX82_SPOFR|nr:cyclin-dependent kinase 11B-like [Spodoptera frugiperda]
MEYVPHEVYYIMQTMRSDRQMFGPEHVKSLMIELLTAVQYLHHSSVFHRDLKPSNIILTEDGILKVADFGLAREYKGPHKQYSPDVATLWYCAPELLLDTKTYGTPIDMWSVGCIFAEVIVFQPLFVTESVKGSTPALTRERISPLTQGISLMP